MFGHYNKPKPRPRYNITVDGHGDYRVETVVLSRAWPSNSTGPAFRAQVYFANRIFGNQIQAEKAIMDFEAIEKLNIRQVVAQVF